MRCHFFTRVAACISGAAVLTLTLVAPPQALWGGDGSLLPVRDLERFAQRVETEPMTIVGVYNTTYVQAGKRYEGPSKGVSKRARPYYLLMTTNQDGSLAANSFCYANNSKYFFELQSNKRHTAWLPTKIGDMAPDFDNPQYSRGFIINRSFRQAVDTEFSRLTRVPLLPDVYAPVAVDALSGLPKYRLESIGPVGNRLRATFAYEVTDPDTKAQAMSECAVEFETSVSSLLASVDQSYNAKGHQVSLKWRRDWTQNSKDNYSAKTTYTIRKGGGPSAASSIDYTGDVTLTFGSIPEHEFTMSAFGLPEPPGIVWSKPTPMYVWFLAAAAGLLGLFGVFWMLARHKSGLTRS